jgi:Transposase DDE domain
MVADASPLVTLVRTLDQMPLPPPPTGRGRPRSYPDRLILKALVIMLVRQLPTVHSLVLVLAEPTPALLQLRALVTDAQGRFPARRTWERRLGAITAQLPAISKGLGHQVLAQIQPWPHGGRATAIDSTLLRARGGVWHKKHREAGVVPHTSIDTDAAWTKSGWHGWVYGWKLHLVVTVSDLVWLPLAAEATPANAADNVEAPALLTGLPRDVSAVLGDQHYNDPALVAQVTAEDRLLITTKRGPYPHTDDGVEVRRIFHQLRSHAIEHCNSQCKDLFGCLGAVPTKGAVATRRFILGAVFLYQLIVLHQHQAGRSLRVGLKPFLLAA